MNDIYLFISFIPQTKPFTRPSAPSDPSMIKGNIFDNTEVKKKEVKHLYCFSQTPSLPPQCDNVFDYITIYQNSLNKKLYVHQLLQSLDLFHKRERRKTVKFLCDIIGIS